MYKGECLHPGLAKMMCEIGHTQRICICDAGYPVPEGPETVHLGWKKGKPAWLDVCEMFKNNISIEKIVLAEEIKTQNPKMHERFKELFSGIDIEYIPHEQFKKDVHEVKGIVKTGEFSPYCNCILQAGVIF